MGIGVSKTFLAFGFFTVEKVLFISGPVVVSPKQNILFTTVLPQKCNPVQTKWFRIQNDTLIEIDFEVQGYEKKTIKGDIITQTVEIPNAAKNFCEYQLCLEDMKSNKITVFSEGKHAFPLCFVICKRDL